MLMVVALCTQVMVLAVLITCPQLKSLRVDGNKVCEQQLQLHPCPYKELRHCLSTRRSCGTAWAQGGVVALHEHKEELWHCMSTRRSCGTA